MAIFHIKKPTYSFLALLKSLLIKAIIVPMILWLPMIFWEVLKRGLNLLAGKAIGNYFFDKKEASIPEEMVNLNDTDALHFDQHTIVAHDGTRLDTLEISPIASNALEPEYKKYIIYFTDKNVCFEDTFSALKDDALEFNSHVVGFNYRGVGKSTGYLSSSYDLVIDGIAQVQRLLDQKISPQNITLKGHSMGGAIAALVAHHFHQQMQPINVFNDRSFSTITNVIVGSIRGGDKETWGGKLLGWFLKPFIKLGLSLVQWEINADDAFKAIPSNYRDYLLVRTSKQFRTEAVIDDVAITTYASMHAIFKSDRRMEKAKIDKLISQCRQVVKDGTPSLSTDMHMAQNALIKARAIFKERKMMNHLHRDVDAHDTPLKELANNTQKTAQTFFGEFLKRVSADHGIHPGFAQQT